ncbi:hypothetical protein HK100_007372, partial [Physocladia obscura]
MEKLPKELVAQIALHIPPTEHRKLRLLSRSLAAKAHFTDFSFALAALLALNPPSPQTSPAPNDINDPDFHNDTGINNDAYPASDPLASLPLARLGPNFSAAAIAIRGFTFFIFHPSLAVLRVATLEQLACQACALLFTPTPLLPESFCGKTQATYALEWSAQKNCLALAKLLLSHGADPNLFPAGSSPSIALAASEGHFDMVTLLLHYHADVSLCESERQFCALNLAAQSSCKNSSAIAKLLLENGAYVDQIDYGRWTPLHWASEMGNLDFVDLLLDQNATIDAKDDQDRTPLHWACAKGQIIVVKHLIEGYAKTETSRHKKRADIHATTAAGSTPLHLAAANGFCNVVTYLLAHQANADARDNTNRTPLHAAADSGYSRVCTLLLESGANPAAADDDAYTPLHAAVISRHSDATRELLAASATPLCAQTVNGHTPLHVAAATDDTQLVEMIINATISRGGHSSCPSKNSELAGLLAMKNIAGHTALQHACVLGSNKSVQLLFALSPDSCFATVSGTTETQGSDVSRVDKDSPLHLAIRFGHFSLVEILVDKILSTNQNRDKMKLLFDSALDFTIDCFLSLRPYATSVDRDIARVLVEKGHAEIANTWEIE